MVALPPRQPPTDCPIELEEPIDTPKECRAPTEMRLNDREKLTVNLLTSNSPTTLVLPCENYGSLKGLLRVTAYVMKSAKAFKKCNASIAGRNLDAEDDAEDIN